MASKQAVKQKQTQYYVKQALLSALKVVANLPTGSTQNRYDYDILRNSS
ncbi:hypothetical protein [Trichocoleus sp. FACHB-262]|nr:hypothetical protein [Trichocoleus sp. FACHB-262]MBD2122133.1 hypothetical protein [Trichocoleus sp. FACHB-262]